MLHDLLIEELNHRVKNTLAILQSIAARGETAVDCLPHGVVCTLTSALEHES